MQVKLCILYEFNIQTMTAERHSKKPKKETGETFSLPSLPPMPSFSGGFDGPVPSGRSSAGTEGLGDEVESILFDLKSEALFVQRITDKEKIDSWMKTKLKAMLESAKQKKDGEFIGKFESAIARLSRFNQ